MLQCSIANCTQGESWLCHDLANAGDFTLLLRANDVIS
jgi:hypothetical protein